MIKTAIIGATGYVGVEMLRILLEHPDVDEIFCSSVSFENQEIERIYANLLSLTAGKCPAHLMGADEAMQNADVVFTALPHGIAEQYAAVCIERGKKLIDLSADFRYGTDEATFKTWYGKEWAFPKIHEEAVYGSPEMNREAIKSARVVGNPGCYVTAATLALLPALKAGLVDMAGTIIVDGKSGVSGAGRNTTQTSHFCECGESVSAYSVGKHRHQSEIQRNCTILAGKEAAVIFTAHLLPQSRGVFDTVYAPLKAQATTDEVRALYERAYEGEPFVRVLPEGIAATTRNVRYSNYCDVQLYVVNGGKTLEVTSCLDNMIKGAAGQAVENMNLMAGFDEKEGLTFIPPAF